MLPSVASLLIPLALSTSLGTAPPSLHREVKAFVTGYNTVAGQTDSTPCIAASGADICGRHDAVACPRQISLGTTVEIRGSTYVCEDRLAKKYDNRFDISCDKDTECPPGVTGWATIKVYDIDRPQPEAMLTPAVLRKAPPPRPLPVLLGHYAHLRRPAIGLKDIARSTPKLASLAASASVLRGRG